MDNIQKEVLRREIERGNSGCYMRVQVLREALKVSSPVVLISRKVPRYPFSQ